MLQSFNSELANFKDFQSCSFQKMDYYSFVTKENTFLSVTPIVFVSSSNGNKDLLKINQVQIVTTKDLALYHLA